MSKQRGFDFAEPPPMPAHCGRVSPIKTSDPNVDIADEPRLSGQNGEILAILRSKREVSNAELVKIANKYTGRLSDLRKAGYTVNARRGEGGLWWYSLEESSC